MNLTHNKAAETAHRMMAWETENDPGIAAELQAIVAGRHDESAVALRRMNWARYRRLMRTILPAAQACLHSPPKPTAEQKARAIAIARRGLWMPAKQAPPPNLHLQQLLVWVERRDGEGSRRWPAVALYEAGGWILGPGEAGARVTHYRPLPIGEPADLRDIPRTQGHEQDQADHREDPDEIEMEAERYEQQ